MTHMVIMRGGPGSGKSTFARERAAELGGLTVICSADDFFINAAGVYDFDPAWLGRAHGACLKRCVESIVLRKPVVIDNTNGSPNEMLPYLALCQAFGYSCEVIRVICDPEVAWARQTHGVPRDKFDEIVATVMQQQVPKLYRKAPWITIRDVGEKLGCNCGVGMGLRNDHESQCRATYIQRDQ